MRFGCVGDDKEAACFPAILATRYHELPWQWAATLTAPPGMLSAYFAEWRRRVGQWDLVSDLDHDLSPPDLPHIPLVASMRKKYVAKIDHPRYEAVGRELAALVPDSFPFWLGTIAAHPKPVGKAKSANMEAIVSNGVPHVHLIIGGISYTRIRTILGAWPGIKKWRKVSTPWNWLHYLLSQELKDDHRRDLFSHCHNLLQPPIESWNLEAVLIAHRYRLRIKRRRDRHKNRRKS